MQTVYIIDAVRTPIGKYGGALSAVRPDDLLALVIKELMARNRSVDPASIEDVIAGDANQAGEDNRNVARMAALLAGLPASVAGNTVNRLCASGLQAIMDHNCRWRGKHEQGSFRNVQNFNTFSAHGGNNGYHAGMEVCQ